MLPEKPQERSRHTQSTEVPEEAKRETERVSRLAFIAGGEFMRDSIRKTRWGGVANANIQALVRAAIDYSGEAVEPPRSEPSVEVRHAATIAALDLLITKAHSQSRTAGCYTLNEKDFRRLEAIVENAKREAAEHGEGP